MKALKSVLLSLAILLFCVSSANATEPAGYLTQYQAVGVVQYEEANQTMVADTFDVGNLLSLAACNLVIADHNQLLQEGSVTPSGGNVDQQKNTRSAVDAICHTVMPPSLPGYYFIGQTEVKQHSQKAQPKQIKIGPFATLALCNSAGNAQKTLTLQKTPRTQTNVYYQLRGGCRKMMD